jgi:cytochrome c oxidase assembly protein subunit 15
VQAVWLQLREPKRFVRIVGWSSVGAVIAQGVLGGLTVIFLLPHAISIAHAGLAEIFLCLNVSIAFFTSPSFLELRQRSRVDVPVTTTTALVGIVYLQILAGALVRHLGAGLAIPDFPLSFGQVIPAMTSAAIAANFAHRVGAACVTALVFFAVAGAWRTGESKLRALSLLLVAVIALQVTLGAEVVWHGHGDANLYHSLAGTGAMRQALITSAHVVTGAAALAISVLMALSCRALARPATRTAASLVQAEVGA